MIRFLWQHYPIRNILFVIGDSIIILSAVLLASRLVLAPDQAPSGRVLLLRAMLILFVVQLFIYYRDVYDVNKTGSVPEPIVRLMQAFGLASLCLALVYYLLPILIIGPGVFVVSVAIAAILVAGWHLLYKIMIDHGWLNRRVMILGGDDLAHQIALEIASKRDCGFTVNAVVFDAGEGRFPPGALDAQTEFKVDFDQLVEFAVKRDIGTIVVAIKDRRGKLPIEELLRCRVNGIEVTDGISFLEMLSGKLIAAEVAPSWLIFSEGFHKSLLRRCFKRLIDILFAVFILVVLSPLALLLAILIKLESKGPVLFSQDRVGHHKKVYRMHKFRSMVEDAEDHSGPVWARSDDDRITRIGRVIRRFRIDEFPQVWNVLKGDMSFVGPRPERPYFVEKLEQIIPYYQQRYAVKPGISGWAQVSYGYGATVEDAIEKLNYDLFYIKNMSTALDVIIILKTFKTVLFDSRAH